MPQDTAFGVFEIGMNHAGEIAPLARLVRPHVAIVTAVDAVHMEFFASVEAIAEEKGEIFAGLVPGGTAIVNRDTQFFRLLRRKAEGYGASRVVGFGTHSEADARLLAIEPAREGARVTAMILGRPLSYSLGAPAATGRRIRSRFWLPRCRGCGCRARGRGARPREAREGPRRAHAHSHGGRHDRAHRRKLQCESRLDARGACAAWAKASAGTSRATDRGAWATCSSSARRPRSIHRDLAPEIEKARIDLVFTAGPLMAALARGHACFPSRRSRRALDRSRSAPHPRAETRRRGDGQGLLRQQDGRRRRGITSTRAARSVRRRGNHAASIFFFRCATRLVSSMSFSTSRSAPAARS